MIRILVLVMAVAVLSLPLNAQTGRFLEVSTQYSIVPGLEIKNQGVPYSSFYPQAFGYSILENYKTLPGINITAGHHFKLPLGFGLRAGTGISWVSFNRSVKVEMPPYYSGISDLVAITGVPIGDIYGMQGIGTPRITRINPFSSTVIMPSEDVGKTSIFFLNIPVSLAYGFFQQRLMVSAGLSGQLLIWSSQIKNRIESNLVGGTHQVEYTDTSSDGLSNFLLNAEMSASWRLTGKIRIVTTYNHGLTPIYDPDLRFAGKSYFRNISLGVGYGL